MKNTILTSLFLLFFIKTLAQDFKIPDFNFRYEVEGLNIYLDRLKIKDEQALIIKMGVSSHWTEGEYADFLVFENDGNVTFYECFFPNDLQKKQKIKKQRIKKSKRKFYWDFLSNSHKRGRFSLKRKKLNITTKPNGDDTFSRLVISDGRDYTIKIIQGSKYISYSTYEPKTFIEQKYPGWEERKKFMNLRKDINDLIQKY